MLHCQHQFRVNRLHWELGLLVAHDPERQDGLGCSNITQQSEPMWHIGVEHVDRFLLLGRHGIDARGLRLRSGSDHNL